MNIFENTTIEECMSTYVKENEMKDEDILKGAREKCPICGIKMFENNYLEALEEATIFFTCSNCRFEKQAFYNVDIEDNLVYENEKVIYNPEEEEIYNVNLKGDIILEWNKKQASKVSWLKLNKSEIKHLKVLLENNLNIYKDVFLDEEKSIIMNKKIRELKKIINKINRL